MLDFFRDITQTPGPKLESKILKVAKKALDSQLTILSESYVGLGIMKKRDDLREAFGDHLQEISWIIGNCDSPRSALRRLIVDNIRVNTVYGRLITEDGEGNGRVLYDEINRWTEEARQDPDIWKPIGQVLDQERYDHPMGYAKVVHEFAWSEVEGLVLRHLQVIFFKESTRPGEDWAEIFREACEMLVTELYRRAIEDAPSENGFPHPLIVAFCNDELSEYAEKMIAEV